VRTKYVFERGKARLSQDCPEEKWARPSSLAKLLECNDTTFKLSSREQLGNKKKITRPHGKGTRGWKEELYATKARVVQTLATKNVMLKWGKKKKTGQVKRDGKQPSQKKTMLRFSLEPQA